MTAAPASDRRAWIPIFLAMGLATPAFYAQWELGETRGWASLLDIAAAACLAVSWWTLPHAQRWMRMRTAALVAGLLASAVLPDSNLQDGTGTGALALRTVVALSLFVHGVLSSRPLVHRGSLAYLLLSALGILIAAGAGFWWLEPRTPTFHQGLWLAFTTAATVGYGDVVPSTPASKIFACFVVLLGLGVLTLCTAAIATAWIQTEERHVEADILHELHREVGRLRLEVRQLRDELRADRPGPPPVTSPDSMPPAPPAAPAGHRR